MLGFAMCAYGFRDPQWNFMYDAERVRRKALHALCSRFEGNVQRLGGRARHHRSARDVTANDSIISGRERWLLRRFGVLFGIRSVCDV